MAMIGSASDMVVTYTATYGGKTSDSGTALLLEYLNAGYRVVDVISTPSNGASASGCFVAVTVVLTYIDPETDTKYNYYAGKSS
jgi:hypothetical protein